MVELYMGHESWGELCGGTVCGSCVVGSCVWGAVWGSCGVRLCGGSCVVGSSVEGAVGWDCVGGAVCPQSLLVDPTPSSEEEVWPAVDERRDQTCPTEQRYTNCQLVRPLLVTALSYYSVYCTVHQCAVTPIYTHIHQGFSPKPARSKCVCVGVHLLQGPLFIYKTSSLYLYLLLLPTSYFVTLPIHEWRFHQTLL